MQSVDPRALWRQLRARPMRLVWAAASLLAVAAALLWLMRGLDGSALLRVLAAADARWLAPAVLCVAATQALRVLRWRVLLPGLPAPWPQLARAVLGAQTINWLSPLRVGEFWRAWAVAGRDMPAIWNVARSIVAEKAIDAAVLATGALLLALGGGGEAGGALPRLAAAVLGLGLLYAATRALRSSRVTQWVAQAWPQAVAQRDLRAQLPALPLAALARAGLLGIGVWGAGALINVFVARALGFELGAMQVLAFMLAVQVGISAAAVPANLGVFPLAALAVLPGMGIGEPDAAAFGLLVYVVVYAAQSALTLAAWLAHGARSPRVPG